MCVCSDVTAATWGGSTVQSDPEDTVTSVSLPSDIAADITQESNENAGVGVGGCGHFVPKISNNPYYM